MLEERDESNGTDLEKDEPPWERHLRTRKHSPRTRRSSSRLEITFNNDARVVLVFALVLACVTVTQHVIRDTRGKEAHGDYEVFTPFYTTSTHIPVSPSNTVVSVAENRRFELSSLHGSAVVSFSKLSISIIKSHVVVSLVSLHFRSSMQHHRLMAHVHTPSPSYITLYHARFFAILDASYSRRVSFLLTLSPKHHASGQCLTQLPASRFLLVHHRPFFYRYLALTLALRNDGSFARPLLHATDLNISHLGTLFHLPRTFLARPHSH